MKETLPRFTAFALALRNGVDREEVWCAYRGKIYDLGKSKLWKGGKHYEHWAGQDLTDELKEAPHTDRVFEKFDIVGILVQKNDR